MSGTKPLRGLALCGLTAFSFGALAQEQGRSNPSENPSPKWGAHIDLEAKPGSKRNLGEADLFIPLMQNETTLFFGNLRGRFDDDSNREGNFGLGIRHMLKNGWNLGTYGYWDRRHTDAGNYFSQATVGAEALGRDWDMRINGYLPVGDKAKDLPSISTAALSGASVQVTTSLREERALKGFDAEVGWRTPLFDAESLNQLRLYAGGFYFSDDGLRVSGPRLRAELTVNHVPGLWTGSEMFISAETQHDNERGGQSFLGLRLRIPFGGKAEQSRQLTLQEQRMTAPTVRDVDIMSQSRVASTLVETATATANGQALTVINSGTTNGAALPGAVAAAGANSTVVLTGTYNTTTSTTLQPGQTLMGRGTLDVRTPSGRTATLTTPGAAIHGDIAGGGAVATVVMASNSTVNGMTITHLNSTNSAATAIRASGVSNVQITNNNISASSGGLALTAQGVLLNAGTTNAAVSNNIIDISTGTSTQNLVGINASPGGFSTVTISNNTVTITGTGLFKAGIGAAGGVPGGTIATITGNTLDVTGGGGANNAVHVINTAVTAGSTGNVRVNGGCSYQVGSTGTIGFTDGTTCP